MEEKRKYVIYYNIDGEEIERIVSMTKEKADAIQWFIDTFDLDGEIELIEKYEGEEI